MHQKAAAIRCRRNLLDEQAAHAVDGIAVCQSEVQGASNLPAELSDLALGLPITRTVAGVVFAESFNELRIYVLYFLRATCIVLQDETPYCAHAHRADTHKSTCSYLNLFLLKTMGVGLAGEPIYSAAGRLDGIGRRAIGDMVSSAVASR